MFHKKLFHIRKNKLKGDTYAIRKKVQGNKAQKKI